MVALSIAGILHSHVAHSAHVAHIHHGVYWPLLHAHIGDPKVYVLNVHADIVTLRVGSRP